MGSITLHFHVKSSVFFFVQLTYCKMLTSILGWGCCGSLRSTKLSSPSLAELVDQLKTTEYWARLMDIWGGDAVNAGPENVAELRKNVHVEALRSGLLKRMSLVRSGISRLLGFPSKSAYFAFWKKLFLFDIVANVARVGGSLLLYVFAPHFYQLLPGGLVG